MGLETRNINLINKVQTVYIKTVRDSSLTAFSKLYATFSKTNFSVNSSFSASGLQYNVQLDCFYPGYDESKLAEIHSFLKEQFIIKLQHTNGSIISIAKADEPLEVKMTSDEGNTKFSFFGPQTQYITPTTLETPETVNSEFPYVFPMQF